MNTQATVEAMASAAKTIEEAPSGFVMRAWREEKLLESLSEELNQKVAAKVKGMIQHSGKLHS